jgi:hypothetical protein
VGPITDDSVMIQMEPNIFSEHVNDTAPLIEKKKKEKLRKVK